MVYEWVSGEMTSNLTQPFGYALVRNSITTLSGFSLLRDVRFSGTLIEKMELKRLVVTIGSLHN